jgi:hypothetical protein
MEESDMLHESDHENQSERNAMGEDCDLDDAVLWGEDDGSDDDSGEENEDNEMESDDDEDGEANEHGVPPPFVLNPDGRPVNLWNLRGQLGALCVLALVSLRRSAQFRVYIAHFALAAKTYTVGICDAPRARLRFPYSFPLAR